MSPAGRDLFLPDQTSDQEKSRRQAFFDLYKSCPIPPQELLSNLGLFVKRQTLSRWLFMHHLYQQILEVHGVVMEFGVRWGQNLALFESFRGMYEPYNHSRRIVGFDTFDGFPSVSAKDGADPIIREGALSVTEGYEQYLDQVLRYHESESPLSHLKKFELVKGDAIGGVKSYLEQNPHTIVALAYFDFDLYEPTKEALLAIRDRLTRGSVIGFDELCAKNFPGETLALKETLGIQRFSVRRYPNSSMCSYVVID
jgi:hypothetical protein